MGCKGWLPVWLPKQYCNEFLFPSFWEMWQVWRRKRIISFQCKYAYCYSIEGTNLSRAFLALIHAHLPFTFYVRSNSVYFEMTENTSTSHSLIVWTQEANWPYRGQTHKVVLAGVVCLSACVYACGRGRPWEALPPILLLLKSSHEHPCQELQYGLSGPGQPQSRLHDASYSWFGELLQPLLFRPQSKELDRKTNSGEWR